jgi:hypothetical protein
MTTKKKLEKIADTIVPVMKQKYVEVRRLGTRATADFEDELRGLFAKGYKVVGSAKKADCVAIQLAIVEEWSFDEFMTDLRGQLAEVAPASPRTQGFPSGPFRGDW